VATGDRREAVMYSTQITHALRTAMVSTTTVNYAARATTFPAAIGVAPPGLGQSWSGPIFANPVGLATATG